MGITHTHNSTYRSDHPGEGNVQWRASFEFLPKGRGNDHIVFHGRMFRPGNNFYMTRQHAAVKVSRLKAMKEDDWDFYIDCSNEAKKYSKAFKDIIKLHKLKIKISFLTPCVAPLDTVSKVTRKYIAKKYRRKFASGEYVVIERFLRGKFQDFISVIGEVLDKRIGILEAFSHFTYWQSSGDLIICGLKGLRSSVDRGPGGEWKVIELSSPCIHSIDGHFGQDDLGEEGIKMFFKQHKCNQICSSWADFETINRQRLLNNSLVPVDADDGASRQEISEETQEKQVVKGSPTKPKEPTLQAPVLELPKRTEKVEPLLSKSPPPVGFVPPTQSPKIDYVPPKPYPDNFLSINTEEDDSGIETSPSASTPDGSVDSLASFSEITNPEFEKRSYIKYPVSTPVNRATEVTTPKFLSVDCDKSLVDGHTIVFQRDGERTMKPIIRNGYARHDDIEIKIENTPSFEEQRKLKRVSWSPNVASH